MDLYKNFLESSEFSVAYYTLSDILRDILFQLGDFN